MKPCGILNKLIVLSICILNLFSCTRPNSDEALVKFDLPATYWLSRGLEQGQNQSNYVSNILKVAQSTTRITSSSSNLFSIVPNGSWGTIIPTGYQTGPYDNNCLFIVATGPELSRFACYKNGNADPVFKVGEISNVAYVGSQVSLKVAPGNERVFLLLGMHAKSIDECVDFNSALFDRSRLTRPYIIGKTDPVTVEAGVENKFILKAIQGVNQDEYIDYCDAVDLSGLYSQPTNLNAGRIDLSFNRELTKNASYHSQCLPVTITVKDSTGLVNLQSRFTDNLSLESVTSGTPTTVSGTPVAVFTNVQDCLNTTNFQTSFNTYKKYETTVWISSSITVLNNKILRLQRMNADGSITMSEVNNLTDTNRTVDVKATEVASVVSTSSSKVPVTQLPEFILNDVCYQATFSANNSEFSTPGFIATGQSMVINHTENSTTGRFSFYTSKSNCESDVGSLSLINFSSFNFNQNFESGWMKATGFSAGEIIVISNTYSETNSTNRAILTVASGTDDLPTSLKITGPQFLTNPTATSCYGPFRIELTNKSGVSVASIDRITKLPRDYDLKFAFDNNSTTAVFARGDKGNISTNAQCSGAAINSGDVVKISSSENYFEFYIRIYSYTTAADSLFRYITVSDTEALVNDTYLLPSTHLLKIYANGGSSTDDDIPPRTTCDSGRLQPVNCINP